MSERLVLQSRAHVFQLDPITKKDWVPHSQQSVPVSFFYDNEHKSYKIIGIDGNKSVVSSTLTPNMTFIKTSPKFGQWVDVKAAVVYGLGFQRDTELIKFEDKFNEIKTHLKKGIINNVTNSPSPKLSNGPPYIEPYPMKQGPGSGGGVSPPPYTYQHNKSGSSLGSNPASPCGSISSLDSLPIKPLNEIHTSRNHLQQPHYSPPTLTTTAAMGDNIITTTPELQQLKYENERLRLTLSQSTSNAKKWEVELETLEATNQRLKSALKESSRNVEEWQKQLNKYRDECLQAQNKILRLETEADALRSQQKDSDTMRHDILMLERTVQVKDGELETVRRKYKDLDLSNQQVEIQCHELQKERQQFVNRIEEVNSTSNNITVNNSAKLQELEELNLQLKKHLENVWRIHELTTIKLHEDL